MPKDVIDVLLATYNGERFLHQFLDSLAKQKAVLINLKVSDDGSNDETLKILEEYKSQFHSYQLLKGPGKGPAKNFLFLLKHTTSAYAAFADQDDIWDPEHLSNSISRIKKTKIPALTFSSVREFSTSPENVHRVWPRRVNLKTIENIAFENYARGCAIVMNAAAIQLINSKSPKYVIMHDWWVLQVLHCCGEIYFSSLPELNYRIHDGNFSKTKSSPMWNFLKTLKSGNWLPIRQLQSLVECYKDEMDQVTKEKILRLMEASQNTKKGLTYILTSKERHRMKFISEVKLRIGFIFSNVLTRNNPGEKWL